MRAHTSCTQLDAHHSEWAATLHMAKPARYPNSRFASLGPPLQPPPCPHGTGRPPTSQPCQQRSWLLHLVTVAATAVVIAVTLGAHGGVARTTPNHQRPAAGRWWSGSALAWTLACRWSRPGSGTAATRPQHHRPGAHCAGRGCNRWLGRLPSCLSLALPAPSARPDRPMHPAVKPVRHLHELVAVH